MKHGQEIQYKRDGSIYSDTIYEHGFKHGPFILFDQGKQIIGRRGHYHYDQLHGPQEDYYYGILTNISEYKYGVKDGFEIQYNLAGKIVSKCQWVNGKRTGLYEIYHLNGHLHFSGCLFEEKAHGPCSRFNENGNLIDHTIYYMGNPIIS